MVLLNVIVDWISLIAFSQLELNFLPGSNWFLSKYTYLTIIIDRRSKRVLWSILMSRLSSRQRDLMFNYYIF